MCEKVAAVNRVVKMNHRRVALAFRIDRAVDSALRAHRMRSLDRYDREQVDLLALLRELHRRGQTSQPAAYDYVMPWHWLFSSGGCAKCDQNRDADNRQHDKQRDARAVHERLRPGA